MKQGYARVCTKVFLAVLRVLAALFWIFFFVTVLGAIAWCP